MKLLQSICTQKEVCILSVIDKTTDLIIEHRLILSEESDESDDALLDACARHVSNWDEHTADDHEAIQDNGYYDTGTKHICVIHLDTEGRYDQ